MHPEQVEPPDTTDEADFEPIKGSGIQWEDNIGKYRLKWFPTPDSVRA